MPGKFDIYRSRQPMNCEYELYSRKIDRYTYQSSIRASFVTGNWQVCRDRIVNSIQTRVHRKYRTTSFN